MKIYLDEFYKWQDYIKKINSTDIKDWELIDLDGSKITLPKETIE